MRWSCRFNGGARKVVICDERDFRLVQRRRGCRSSAMKSRNIVQSVMRNDRKAQGPDRKS